MDLFPGLLTWFGSSYTPAIEFVSLTPSTTSYNLFFFPSGVNLFFSSYPQLPWCIHFDFKNPEHSLILINNLISKTSLLNLTNFFSRVLPYKVELSNMASYYV